MTLQDLGSLGEFGGAIAVVGSLVYLALQIRQNSKLLRFSIMQALKRDAFDIRRVMIQDPELTAIFQKGMQNPDSLDDLELSRFFVGFAATFDHWQHLHMWRNEGGIDWSVHENSIRSFFSQPGVRKAWEVGKPMCTKEFISYVESEILSGASEAPYWLKRDNPVA